MCGDFFVCQKQVFCVKILVQLPFKINMPFLYFTVTDLLDNSHLNFICNLRGKCGKVRKFQSFHLKYLPSI